MREWSYDDLNDEPASLKDEPLDASYSRVKELAALYRLGEMPPR